MKTIKTNNGDLIVDDDIYDLIKDAPIAWSGSYPSIRIHHLVCKPTDPSKVIDHIDRNPLNNTKLNLRSCSKSQNGLNKIKQKGYFTSKFMGVSFHKKTNKFRMRVLGIKDINDPQHELYDAKFDLEEEAARARDICALVVYGEYINTNFPRDTYNGLDMLAEAEKYKKGRIKTTTSCTSRYRGVNIRKRNNNVKITATIKYQKKVYFLGVFDTEELAALAYNTKSLELKIKNPKLNHISGPYLVV